ncbi:hypothetical protein [Ruminococcus sp. NK3A76]|uniref:hypothetical protein n=1 Tax=Ruminococcus sp. NK3A76 TaxID=877411 RepID=UPI00048EF108|nr:hypothetical protein [Ruminococcus sp. NK3A76]
MTEKLQVRCVQSRQAVFVRCCLNNLQDPEDNIDLSERHLVWFSSTPLPEDNYYCPMQAGEGGCRYVTENERAKNDPDNKVINTDIFAGGTFSLATTAFSTQQGPCEEKAAPFLSTFTKTGY